MAKNWAIVIGINNYLNLQRLDFAQSDAEAMKEWFLQEAKFDQVFLFTENSPPIPTNTQPIPTQPTFGILMSFLGRQFKKPLLTTGDNLWFFFSGHGQRSRDKDYLMLKDTNPGDIERTAISVEYVTERLRGSGADNVILFLDACRSQGAKDGLGYGEEQYQGVITFYSCKAEQTAWEIPKLKKGAFTHTLLEGLRLGVKGNCAAVHTLHRYLENEVPKLNQKHGKPIQNPYLKADPPYKMYYILLPQSANSSDILNLKNEVRNAESRNDSELADKLRIRILAVDDKDNEEVDSRYAKLETLLKAKNFRAADEETYKVMLAVANRESEGWLRREDAQRFPCRELRSIDKLWLKYSRGKFGISVQQQIYQRLGGTEDFNLDVWRSMGDLVGWRSGGNWLSNLRSWMRGGENWLFYSDLNFSQTAPLGHLPFAFALFREKPAFFVFEKERFTISSSGRTVIIGPERWVRKRWEDLVYRRVIGGGDFELRMFESWTRSHMTEAQRWFPWVVPFFPSLLI